MFTGIVKGLGTIISIDHRSDFIDIVVNVASILDSTSIGSSVAINGVCLTVIAIDGSKWTFSVMQETLDKTTIGQLAVGDKVCLEQPLRMGDELGGHMVLGHVDGVGVITEKIIDGENCRITIESPPSITKYIVQKGSITIDGISLTVCDPVDNKFSVSLLPLTLELTTLGFKTIGDHVNLEADYILKAMMK